MHRLTKRVLPVQDGHQRGPHSSLCYLTPAEFARAHTTTPIAADLVEELTVDVSWLRRQNLVVTPGLSQLLVQDSRARQIRLLKAVHKRDSAILVRG